MKFKILAVKLLHQKIYSKKIIQRKSYGKKTVRKTYTNENSMKSVTAILLSHQYVVESLTPKTLLKNLTKKNLTAKSFTNLS